MSDRERIEKGLNICTSAEPCNGCPYLNERNCSLAMVKDALAIQKEQQQLIWELQDQVEYLTDKQKEQKFLVDSDGKITPLPVVVRCKDCKHGEPDVDIDGDPCIHCRNRLTGIGKMLNIQPEWFCANGERR